MSDRFFTLMLVPEKSERVRKITLPTLYLKLGGIVGALLLLIGAFVFFDYLHILSQIAENKRLRAENHLLRTDVANAKNRLDSLDQSVGRLKTFAHKLRVIGNLDSPQAGQLLQAPETRGMSGGTEGDPDSGEDSGNIVDPESQSSNAKPETAEVVAIQLLPQSSDLGLESRAQVGSEFSLSFDAAPLLDQVALLMQATGRLREIAELEEQNLADLQEQFQDRVDKLLATPSILPTRGFISSRFGYRHNPFSQTRTFHAGIDISNKVGTPIFAPADGVVTYVGNLGGFGQVVRVDHGYNIVTKYGHNSRLLVKKGERIRRGDRIAEMGSSGRSTGPHLHYQVEIKGKPVNPRYFFFEDTF